MEAHRTDSEKIITFAQRGNVLAEPVWLLAPGMIGTGGTRNTAVVKCRSRVRLLSRVLVLSLEYFYFYISECCLLVEVNREGVVLIVIVNTPHTGPWRNGSSISGKGKKHSSSPKRPDRLWCPFCLPFNVYCSCFSMGYSGCGVKLTTHLV
jgi:hypothetical protein